MRIVQLVPAATGAARVPSLHIAEDKFRQRLMKLFLLFAFMVHLLLFSKAQSAEPKLPWAYYMTMVNTCNTADIVLLKGDGGSINIDKANMGIIKEFITDNNATVITDAPTANIMCQIDGREFISGQIFVKGNEGIVTFTVNDRRYANRLSEKGVEFFRSVIASL
ncbi:MAG: hypothetical protein KIS94_16230 [Chitinophagales bacterium]|nr:hypothetical protein [Chitinophagales bacterium]